MLSAAFLAGMTVCVVFGRIVGVMLCPLAFFVCRRFAAQAERLSPPVQAAARAKRAGEAVWRPALPPETGIPASCIGQTGMMRKVRP